MRRSKLRKSAPLVVLLVISGCNGCVTSATERRIDKQTITEPDGRQIENEGLVERELRVEVKPTTVTKPR